MRDAFLIGTFHISHDPSTYVRTYLTKSQGYESSLKTARRCTSVEIFRDTNQKRLTTEMKRPSQARQRTKLKRQMEGRGETDGHRWTKDAFGGQGNGPKGLWYRATPAIIAGSCRTYENEIRGRDGERDRDGSLENTDKERGSTRVDENEGRPETGKDSMG